MSKNTVFYVKVCCLAIVVILACCVVGSRPPIAQDADYHRFADTKNGLGIMNVNNVLSNLLFVVAGIAGFVRINRLPCFSTAAMWRFFYGAIVLVGIGSAYYHLWPGNDTLVWDRLPMTLGFAALTACIFAERINLRIGRLLFWPLIISGLLSVLYWWLTERAGAGDLRPYILVQFLPILLIPLVILLFPSQQSRSRPYWLLLISYILAKVFELQDHAVFIFTNMEISGHTLKHLMVGIGLLIFQRQACPAYCARPASDQTQASNN